MNAVTTRPHIAKAKPIFTAPAAKPATRDFDEDDARLFLLRASSISTFLMNIFGNGAAPSANEVRGLEGLMGSIQHLRRILHDLNETLAPCTDADFCALVLEASSLAALFDEVEWLGGYKFHQGDHQISCYFDTITYACDRAIALLSGEAVQP